MELSFPEIALVFAIALIVLGPKELLRLSEETGRWAGKMRSQFNNMKVMLRQEIIDAEKHKVQISETEKLNG